MRPHPMHCPILIAVVLPCGVSRGRGRGFDSGVEIGAEGRWQAPSRTASVPVRDRLTCADVRNQAEHSPVCLADTEEVTGSIPVPPTSSLCRSEGISVAQPRPGYQVIADQLN